MPETRLQTRYREEILPALTERFGYSTPMRVPRIVKVTVNMGVGDAKQDSKMLEAATEQLATITGQHPNITITTTAQSDDEAFALLEALGMPFSREGRPEAAATT